MLFTLVSWLIGLLGLIVCSSFQFRHIPQKSSFTFRTISNSQRCGTIANAVLDSSPRKLTVTFSARNKLALTPLTAVSKVSSNAMHIIRQRNSGTQLHLRGGDSVSALSDPESTYDENGKSILSRIAPTFQMFPSSKISAANHFKPLIVPLISVIAWKPLFARASGSISSSGPDTMMNLPGSPIQGLLLWTLLFAWSAVMHSAESALTRLSVWQVQELAQQQGPRSPFASLSENLTRYLIAILLTTTACSIYSTALFVACVSRLFPTISLGTVTAALTLLTLFLGELLPKAIAVRHSAAVARITLPLIAGLSALLAPLTAACTLLSDASLRWLGLGRAMGGASKGQQQEEEETLVSEDMLRRVVREAQRSSRGIETGEGRMITGVLDMQDKEVGRIMRPRVDIMALPETTSAQEILRFAVSSRYSRIPIFRRDVDHIVGIVFTKDLLHFMQQQQQQQQQQSLEQPGQWQSLTARELMEPAYFVPETMSCWDALQEMKRRRTHMAIVVDEYGGTSGLVTFEDILEEVVGEIYDEDDGREDQTDDWTILRTDSASSYSSSAPNSQTEINNVDIQHSGSSSSSSKKIQHRGSSDSRAMRPNAPGRQYSHRSNADLASTTSPILGGNNRSGPKSNRISYNSQRYPTASHSNANKNSNISFLMKASAELDDVCEALGIVLDSSLPECSTLGGLLCALAGRIPQEGESVDLAGFRFRVESVQDNRRLIDVSVTRLPRPASQKAGDAGDFRFEFEVNETDREVGDDLDADDDKERLVSSREGAEAYVDVNENQSMSGGVTADEEEASESDSGPLNSADLQNTFYGDDYERASPYNRDAAMLEEGEEGALIENEEFDSNRHTKHLRVFRDGEWVDADIL